MPATLPDLETATLRRGASNGAELRIELDRPERMNAWDKQLGEGLLAGVERAAGGDRRGEAAGERPARGGRAARGRRERPRGDHHRRGARVLLRRRPARGLRADA